MSIVGASPVSLAQKKSISRTQI